MCKLRETKSRHRESRLPLSSTRFAPPPSQFSGGSLHIPWRTPNPHHVLFSTIEAFFRIVAWSAYFLSMLAVMRSVLVGHEVRGEMGG
jgi:hypothetical protein